MNGSDNASARIMSPLLRLPFRVNPNVWPLLRQRLLAEYCIGRLLGNHDGGRVEVSAAQAKAEYIQKLRYGTWRTMAVWHRKLKTARQFEIDGTSTWDTEPLR